MRKHSRAAMRELKLHAVRKRMDLFLVNVPERIREIFEKISFDISLEELPSRRKLIAAKADANPRRCKTAGRLSPKEH